MSIQCEVVWGNYSNTDNGHTWFWNITRDLDVGTDLFVEEYLIGIKYLTRLEILANVKAEIVPAPTSSGGVDSHW